MKKILALCMTVILFILTGCGKNAEQADNPSNTTTEYSYSETVQLLGGINEILTNASKGAGNPMASLGGFAEELEDIKEKSDGIIERAETFNASLDETKHQSIVKENAIAIADHHTAFDEKLSEIKAAKKKTNISELKENLNTMLSLIDEYDSFLTQLEKEVLK